MGSKSPTEGDGSLTSGCHFFVSRDGALDCPPLASELIRRPPVPAGVGELAPDDLALVKRRDRCDSIEKVYLAFFGSLFSDERSLVCRRFARDRLLVHEDERVQGTPLQLCVFVATVQGLYPDDEGPQKSYHLRAARLSRGQDKSYHLLRHC